MDGLRWILLGCGALVILGIVLFGRRRSSAEQGSESPQTATADASEQAARVEPSFGDADAPETYDSLDVPESPELPEIIIDPAGEQIDIEDVTGQPDAGIDPGEVEQKIVTVRIISQDKNPFPGDQLVLSLRGIGMRHGKFGIFHRYDGNDEDAIVFSAASLVEPGSFELENIREQTIPGISLFMVLPGPLDGAEAFDQMMAASRTLTQSLGAELLDESGSSLSIQRERYLREEIIQYQLQNRIA